MYIFIKKFILFIIIALIAIGTYKLTTNQKVKKTYNSAFIDKLELLRANKEKNKIILIGGSSVGWGLSAKTITDSTGVLAINLGHHAGYGLLDFMPYILNNVNENDLIIFSPEWEFYYAPKFMDQATLNNLICQNLRYGIILDNYSYILRALFLNHLELNDFFALSKSKQSPSNDNPYVYDCLNEFGDVISHYHLQKRNPKSYDLPNKFDENAFTEIFQFVNSQNCYVLFPPTQKNVYVKNAKFLNRIESMLKGKVQIIDSVASNVYDESDFFDAEYHLTFEANTKRTSKVIEFLKRLGK